MLPSCEQHSHSSWFWRPPRGGSTSRAALSHSLPSSHLLLPPRTRYSPRTNTHPLRDSLPHLLLPYPFTLHALRALPIHSSPPTTTISSCSPLRPSPPPSQYTHHPFFSPSHLLLYPPHPSHPLTPFHSLYPLFFTTSDITLHPCHTHTPPHRYRPPAGISK